MEINMFLRFNPQKNTDFRDLFPGVISWFLQPGSMSKSPVYTLKTLTILHSIDILTSSAKSNRIHNSDLCLKYYKIKKYIHLRC